MQTIGCAASEISKKRSFRTCSPPLPVTQNLCLTFFGVPKLFDKVGSLNLMFSFVARHLSLTITTFMASKGLVSPNFPIIYFKLFGKIEGTAAFKPLGTFTKWYL